MIYRVNKCIWQYCNNVFVSKPKTIIIENSFGLKKTPIYLDDRFGKLNVNDNSNDDIVTIFKNWISLFGNSSFKK